MPDCRCEASNVSKSPKCPDNAPGNVLLGFSYCSPLTPSERRAAPPLNRARHTIHFCATNVARGYKLYIVRESRRGALDCQPNLLEVGGHSEQRNRCCIGNTLNRKKK